VFCQFSRQISRHLRKLDEATCAEQRLARVGARSCRKSDNTRHVLSMIRDKLQCLAMMIDNCPSSAWMSQQRRSAAFNRIMGIYLRTTGCCLQYGITQCYLSQETSKHAPTLTPANEGWYSIYLPWRDGRLSWPRCLITPGPGVEPMTARSQVRRPNSCEKLLLTAVSNDVLASTEKIQGLGYDTIRYDTIEEFNVDSKAEYTA